MGGAVSEKEWEKITAFVEEKAKESDWDDPYWISFLNAYNEDLCPHEECPGEVSEMLEKHFEITTGIDIETSWFSWDNCKKVADLICENFAEKWYKYHIEQWGKWALDFEEYKSELHSQLTDGAGDQQDDLFTYDELSGKRLNSWPANESSVIDELEVLVDDDCLTVDEWEGISRIANNFSNNEKVRELVSKIVKKSGM
jgi:hypothetical protein